MNTQNSLCIVHKICKPLLRWSKSNRKIDYNNFSILSGYSCPACIIFKSKAVIKNNTREILDSKHTKIRCYSASQEVQYDDTYNQRKHNFDLLKACKSVNEIYNLLDISIPKIKFAPFRIHIGGDFFNQRYFDGWLKLALKNPKCFYYTYTKSLNYWINRLDVIPDNFKLVASVGGRYDNLIDKYNLISATVVFTESQAEKMGLEIDHDDSIAIENDRNFALDIHGVQSKGSYASKIVSLRKRNGEKIGYSKR